MAQVPANPQLNIDPNLWRLVKILEPKTKSKIVKSFMVLSG
jgi:hypothetical protein